MTFQEQANFSYPTLYYANRKSVLCIFDEAIRFHKRNNPDINVS